jgi:predicted phage tail protein
VYSGIALSFRLQTKYFPTVLRAGFSYSFKVRSVNAAGPSPLSAASEWMLAASAPSAPRNITLVSRSSTSLTI